MNDPGRSYLYKQSSQGKDKLASAPSGISPAGLQRTSSSSSSATRPPVRSRSQSMPSHPEAGVEQQRALTKQGSINATQTIHEAPVAQGSTIALQLNQHRAGDGDWGHLQGRHKWDAALANIEDAKVVVDTLAHALEDAVYLDEDAYNQVVPLDKYTRTIQVQQRRMLQIESELEDYRIRLNISDTKCIEAQARANELEQELENNAVVFKMHYTELLEKDSEIRKLRAIIEGLSSQQRS